jgi:hypothetical protein
MVQWLSLLPDTVRALVHGVADALLHPTWSQPCNNMLSIKRVVPTRAAIRATDWLVA